MTCAVIFWATVHRDVCISLCVWVTLAGWGSHQGKDLVCANGASYDHWSYTGSTRIETMCSPYALNCTFQCLCTCRPVIASLPTTHTFAPVVPFSNAIWVNVSPTIICLSPSNSDVTCWCQLVSSPPPSAFVLFSCGSSVCLWRSYDNWW